MAWDTNYVNVFTLTILYYACTYNRAVHQMSDLLFIDASFWFEESPCAVWTNTARLNRLCSLFVLSTLLVFEHMHAVFFEHACSVLHNGNDKALLLLGMYE